MRVLVAIALLAASVVGEESRPSNLIAKKLSEKKNSTELASVVKHGASAKQPEDKAGNPHPYSATSDPNGPKPEWVNNPLAEYFFQYTTGLMIWKWHHYFRVYHRHLDALRAYPNERKNMLVLGVQSGGEVGMWQNYFGENFYYYGVDINPACKEIEKRYKNTQIFIGDQGDMNFINMVKDTILATGPLHIVLDDGSHITWHQILSFETLYPHLHGYGGTYIIEDVTTSYSPPNDVHRLGSPALNGVPGVMSNTETLIEHMKTRVDFINGYWANPTAAAADPFIQSVDEIAFYDGMVVVEKQPHPHPMQERRGSEEIPYCTGGQQNGCLT